MVDAKLCHNLRRYLEEGKSLIQSRDLLVRFGHTTADIDAAVIEFFKDESTDKDDRLIHQIEHRFKNKKQYLQDIFTDLLNEGHPIFEIEKAMLRAELAEGFTFKKMTARWTAYSMGQAAILVTCMLLAAFYHWSFIISIFFVVICMMQAARGVHKLPPEWRKDFGMIPMTGLWTLDGIFGYNSTTGNYFKFATTDPALIVSSAFFLQMLFAVYIGIWYFIICFYLAALSFFCFSIKPPDSTGPPYSRLLVD